jgi:hypothetical protein
MHNQLPEMQPHNASSISAGPPLLEDLLGLERGQAKL